MSIYYCRHCDNYRDNDYDVAVEDPKEPLELVCPMCAEKEGIEDD